MLAETFSLKIVNFLWSENATAISINEERISPNSHISCIGATILINQTRINNPFQIKAIGKKLSKEKVENALIVLSLLLRGIEINIEENENILIPAKK